MRRSSTAVPSRSFRPLAGVPCVSLLLLLLWPATGSAQEAGALPVRASPEPPEAPTCPADPGRALAADGDLAPDAEPESGVDTTSDTASSIASRPVDATDPDEARELSEAATRAALLGDRDRALELLRRATELDPSSPDLAYRRARAHDERGEGEAATRWYCRYLALAPDGEDLPEVEGRLETLAEERSAEVPEEAARHFREGVRRLRDGDLAAAEDRFSEALRADSSLAGAHYNRGLARGALGRAEAAVRDFEAYLAAPPEAPDGDRVREALAFLRDPPRPYSPAGAFALGTVVPGAGHVYVDRPWTGTAFFGLAAGAGLAGALYETVEVACRAPLEEGRCPPGQVASTTSERPALVPGLVAAGVIAVVGAVSASRTASARNRDAARLRVAEGAREASPERSSAPPRLLGPAVVMSANGPALALLRLRF